MLKLFRYFKAMRWQALAIVLLLMVQAWCDLSLPQYTSDIVDVGIQQGGIENAAAEQLRAESLADLELFIPEEEIPALEAAYAPAENGIRRRAVHSREEIEALNDTLSIPMVMLGFLKDSGHSAAELRQGLDSGILTKDQVLNLGQQVLDKLGDQSGQIAHQRAMLFVREEYEAMDMDMRALQLRYLLAAGSRMLGLSLLIAVTSVLVGLLAARASAGMGMRMRGDVFRKVMSFSNAETDRFSTASLITRTTNDVQQIQLMTFMVLRMVLYAPIIGVGGIVKVASTRTGLGWIIAVAVCSALGLVAVLMTIAMPRFKVMQQRVDRLNLVSREILTGVSVIRAFSREDHEHERFQAASRDLMKTQLFTNRVMTFMMPCMTLIMGCVSTLIVWFGGHGMDSGTMQVGDMIAFLTYTMQIVMAFLMIAMISINLPRAGVAAGRIREVLDAEPSVQDEEVSSPCPPQLTGTLSFEDVSFRYPDSKADVLEHISFTAHPGQTTAIIGSTGSGKSTLLNLIPRFFDASSGRITLDGTDIRSLPLHKLRSLLGYVPQKGVLFSGDIASNLKFGGADITDADMIRAAQIAQAEEFISSRPEGYQTPIAQGGTNVSGGQKQRLSIARAIARHPKILLFDDSFSALDYRTDVTLRRALKEQVQDAAVLIVAQRISTILHADQIIVLEEGHVAGMGTHEQLLRTCPTYQEIARSQLSESELGGDCK